MFSTIVLALAALLLFVQLGHYSLWDDEALVALSAKGVLRTGDTSVQPDGHNLVAYRGGILVRDLKDRSTPPLAAYLAAGSMGLGGDSALAARFPFALFGLATVALLLWWIHQAGSDPLTRILLAMAILGNVSFFLYARQCRYYAPSVFFSMAVVYLYLNWGGSRKRLLGMAVCSVLLFASNYLSFLALYCCLGLDYFSWHRRSRPMQKADWLVLLVPQAVLSGALALVWNPLRTQFGDYLLKNNLSDRAWLFFWNFRDPNTCEFSCGALLLTAAGIALVRKDRWLLRGLSALLVYVLFITCTSPQPVKAGFEADVRYLVALIPLCMIIGALTIRHVAGTRPVLALAIALTAFGSNLLNAGPLLKRGFRSTIVEFVRELSDPPPDPYSAAAGWIKQNVKPGETLWVAPENMTYPLMFHTPAPLYAWQLAASNSDPQFASMAQAMFRGRVLPDYILAFGPISQKIKKLIDTAPNARYEQVATIDCFWKDLYRPELFLRSFKPFVAYNKETEAIYVMKRM